jgi:hypothetical protein
MPRYYFHRCIGERMIWDSNGIELPNLRLASDPDPASLWTQALAGQVASDQILVITDEYGKVLFVAAG